MKMHRLPPVASPAHIEPQAAQAGAPGTLGGSGIPVRKRGIRAAIAGKFSRFTRPLASCLSARRYYRIVGRFYRLRLAYGFLRGAVDRWRGEKSGSVLGERGQGVVQADRGSSPDWTGGCVDALERDGVCTGFRLPPEAVDHIRRYATAQPCTRPGHDRQFLITALCDGRTADGQRVPVADVVAPAACPDVAALLRDPTLLKIATRYLGFRPGRIEPRLYWSPASEMEDDDRRALGQTIDFHYDIDGFHTLYVFFT